MGLASASGITGGDFWLSASSSDRSNGGSMKGERTPQSGNHQYVFNANCTSRAG
jgi:hypothetical protein